MDKENVGMALASSEPLAEIEFHDATDEDLRATILEFYSDHPERTLKTLVCRAYLPNAKRYIAVVTRGDRKIDLTKLSSVMGYKNVRLANADEMKKLELTAGYVSPVDCAAFDIIGDKSIEEYRNYYDGGNRDLLYRKNVNYPRDFVVTNMLDISV